MRHLHFFSFLVFLIIPCYSAVMMLINRTNMLGEIAEKSATNSLVWLPEPDPFLTPNSLTHVLAYLQYYTPKHLPRGRFIAPSHLRTLALWINKPKPKLRSLRQHPALATHFVMLYALGFLNPVSRHCVPQPATSAWLRQPLRLTVRRLQTTLTSPQWQASLDRLNLASVVTQDIAVYLAQSLAQQKATTPTKRYEPIRWLPIEETDQWRIHLPLTLPNWQQFDLRQLGSWSPEEPLVCTPLSIATAVQRGYGAETIQGLLESAAQTPLTETHQIELRQWCRRAHTYQIRTVHLLSTAQPEQTSQLMRQKRLRQSAITQITPRHTIIKNDMAEKLAHWLNKRGYPLDHIPTNTTSQTTVDRSCMDESLKIEPHWQWLCARVLSDLGKLLPLPCPSPNQLLEAASQSLTATEVTHLEATAVQILEVVRQAITGRDAFFPAQIPVVPHMLKQVQQAIEKEKPLTIQYQALTERKPSYRQIQPLRLDHRGQLNYLDAYCYRAETNLTFRLDRISGIEVTDSSQSQNFTQDVVGYD